MKPRLLTVLIEKKLTKNYNTFTAQVGAEIILDESDDFDQCASEWLDKCCIAVERELNPKPLIASEPLAQIEEKADPSPEKSITTPKNDIPYPVGMILRRKKHPDQTIEITDVLDGDKRKIFSHVSQKYYEACVAVIENMYDPLPDPLQKEN